MSKSILFTGIEGDIFLLINSVGSSRANFTKEMLIAHFPISSNTELSSNKSPFLKSPVTSHSPPSSLKNRGKVRPRCRAQAPEVEFHLLSESFSTGIFGNAGLSGKDQACSEEC